MPQHVTINVFLINRLNVELTVVLRSTGLVKIEPHHCSTENLRLWSGIAKTQTTLAQLHLQQSNGRNSLKVLHSLFQHRGWEVKPLENAEEFSL